MGKIGLIALVAVTLACIPATTGSRAAATTHVRVHNETGFEAAVAALRDSGGTIALLPHVYRGELVVPPRSSRPLRIVGEPGVRVERLRLDHTQHVLVSHLRISPVSQDAWIDADASHDLEFDHLLVTAAGTRFRAWVQLPGSDRVTIRTSELTHCGDRSPEFVNCLFLRLVSNLRVEDTWFHDCRGCDFVHGRFGSHFTLLRNRFARALPCVMGGRRCGHQDLIELFSGRGLVVRDNVFGVYRHGGAQLYVTNSIDHVRIVNNVFLGSDPSVPGYHARVALIIGSWGFRRVPHDVRIVNNTILTGARRVDGYEGSIRMSNAYGGLPRARRPLLANNVIGVLEVPQHVCSEAGRSVANVVLRGSGCSRADRVSAGALDGLGRPTPASTALLDHASRRWAPRRDITGRPRGSAPDIGAYELHE
jgi:hypothetical protein